MIYPFDFHTHSIFCDGKDTVEDMIKTAISKNMKSIGFSSHSFTDFDTSYCMSLEDTEKYINKIKLLKNKYKDKIEIFCGIEKDYYSTLETTPFDYIIGSVHYVKKNGIYHDVDLSEDDFKLCVKKYYENNYFDFCKNYYTNVSKLKEKTKCDIIGHFDLVTKFNQNNRLFDEADSRYLECAFFAVDKLIQENAVFEVNTGAISRGYKTAPYPANCILKRICDKNGSVILSSDAHSKETLMFNFQDSLELLKQIGFKSVKVLSNNGFYDIKTDQ